MQSKICTRCNRELPNTNEYFAKTKRGIGGLNSICKKCITDYNKEYYKKNREKLNRDAKEYYLKNKDAKIEYRREYYQKNKDRVREKNKEWATNNPDKMNMYKKEWKRRNPNVDSEYYAENKERLLERNKTYRLNNSDMMKTYKRKWKVKNREKVYEGRKFRDQSNSEGNFTLEEWSEAKNHFNNQCAYCNGENVKLTQDHFIPLSKGGSYTKDNMIPACRKCNSSKFNHDFMTWYEKQESFNIENVRKIEQYLQNIKLNNKKVAK